MVPALLDVFGADGLLSRRFDGYAPRPGQIEMARAVELALDDGQHLAVEGPTGTGKSLAYLVPAVLDAAATGRRVLVVTANIALQEQLVSKDLPLLAEVLPVELSFALVKGKGNYLCLDRLDRERGEGTLLRADDPADQPALEQVVAWAGRTATGDVSELPFEPPPAIWQRLSVRSEDCLGKDCPLHEPCFARRAAERARRAKVVVSNYHLLFAHLVVHEATGEDLVLPPFDLVVLDEAHKAADIARDFFGFRVSLGVLRRVARPLDELGARELGEALRQEARVFCEDLGRLYRSRAYRVRLRSPGAVPSDELLELLGRAAEVYAKAVPSADKEDAPRLARRAERCGQLAGQIRLALGLADPNAVSFIELDRAGRGVLCARPIDVSERLQAGLFDRAKAVIVTSATLSTSGSFELVKAELGVPEARELVVESPFDFAERALLVVPEGLPDPTDPSWPGAVARGVLEAVEEARGRTLALFTSYRSLDVAHRRLAGSGFRVLRQGEMPRTALVEAFRADVGSVLLGTESFWTGIDVPGEALSCVVIDRLPFPSPEDPVLDAIRERDPRWFLHYGLPRAVLAFKQGFGRLLRSAGDRGVVVVLDRRLVARPYGRLFLRSLPPVRLSRRMADVGRFLGTRDAVARGA